MYEQVNCTPSPPPRNGDGWKPNFVIENLSLRKPLPLDDLKALMGPAPAWDLIILSLMGLSPTTTAWCGLLAPTGGSQVMLAETGGDVVAARANGRATS